MRELESLKELISSFFNKECYGFVSLLMDKKRYRIFIEKNRIKINSLIIKTSEPLTQLIILFLFIFNRAELEKVSIHIGDIKIEYEDFVFKIYKNIEIYDDFVFRISNENGITEIETKDNNVLMLLRLIYYILSS